MKLLLHACCGPCALQCVQSLKAEKIIPTLFYYNPNIHPYTEYEARKQSLLTLGVKFDTPTVIHGEYGLRHFLGRVTAEERCFVCYEMRLNETAAYAKANGFEAFTTTLLISPYQNHEMLIQTAQKAASKHHVSFLYRDFRPCFREGQRAAREMGLYMQKYCGCIFSEEERYQKKK